MGKINRQHGAVTIFISMILLFLITILVLTAYTMSTTNLRAVGNVQARNEAISAANILIESSVLGDFWDRSWPLVTTVDVFGDSVSSADDFSVTVLEPQCVRATQAAGTSSSSVTLPGMSSGDFWHTVWEFDATATEATTGAEVNVVQGFRVLVPSDVRDDHCS